MKKDSITENNVFLSVRNLEVRYSSENETVYAVEGVSFDLQKGKTLALVGETGAGTTSIAKAILRILPDISAKVTGGQIILDGEDLLQLEERKMRTIRGNKISMVFQDPMTALNPTMRIGPQIAEGIKIHSKVSRQEAEKRAKEMLETVGIPAQRYNDYPHQFSGGMKQRVVIAIALSCNPELLLADEPTTALDVTIQAQVLNLMKKLKKEFGTSMILITHDLGVVSDISDDVAIIYAGEIIEYGSKYAIFDNPAHPYTQGLFGAVPSMNEDVDRLAPIPGMPPDPTKRVQGCSFGERCPYAAEACHEAKVPMYEVESGHFCRCQMVPEKSAVEDGL